MPRSTVLALAIVIALVVRVAVVAFTSYVPIPNERGKLTSIYHPAPSSDLGHYLAMGNLYLDCGIVKIVKAIAFGHYGMDVDLGGEGYHCDPAAEKTGMFSPADYRRLQI